MSHSYLDGNSQKRASLPVLQAGCSLKVAQMSQADATWWTGHCLLGCGTMTTTWPLHQSSSSWGGSDLRRLLGSVCINYGEALHVTTPRLSLFRNPHLALSRHSEKYCRAGKVAPNTWGVQAHKYF